MLPTRKATRALVGKTLTEFEVQKKYESIVQSKRRISKNETMKAIKRFFKSGQIEATVKTVPLKCPLSKSRIVTPVRGTYCKHVECFDLRTFLEYHTNEVYWECPFTFCRTKLNCDQLRVDEFFSSILENTRSTIEEAQIRPDGTWTSVKPTITGAIVIKEEEPDDLQEPNAQASANAFNAVKEEPLEELSEGGTHDYVNLDATRPKSFVFPRKASRAFKATQHVKRKALRRQWKRVALRPGKTQTTAQLSNIRAKEKDPPEISHAPRSATPATPVVPANIAGHAPTEKVQSTSQSTKSQQPSLPMPLSEAAPPSTEVTQPSQNSNATEGSTPSDRVVCEICGNDSHR